MSSPAPDINAIVLPLAAVQTLIWAVSYYMFPAMLPAWETEFGWSKAALSGAFTLAVVLTALGAPVAGRLIDRDRGAQVMLASIILIGCMLVFMSRVQELWQFYLAWAGIGIGMAGALYEACFAFVTRLLGGNARQGITTITLVAGFASSVAFPSCHALNGLIGWRNTLLVFAVVTALVILPLIWWVSRRLNEGGLAASAASTARTGMHPRQALASPVFWLLAFSFSLIALNHGMIVIHLLPLLMDRGLELGLAVLVASLVGPMQVVGRLLMVAVQHRLNMTLIGVVSIMFMAAAALSLWAAPVWLGLVFLFVVLQGSGYGVTSISRPVVTAEYLGMAHFGAISGFIAVIFMLMSAVSPSVAAAIWSLGGYDLVIGFAFLCCLISVTCLMLAYRRALGPGGIARS